MFGERNTDRAGSSADVGDLRRADSRLTHVVERRVDEQFGFRSRNEHVRGDSEIRAGRTRESL